MSDSHVGQKGSYFQRFGPKRFGVKIFVMAAKAQKFGVMDGLLGVVSGRRKTRDNCVSR